MAMTVKEAYTILSKNHGYTGPRTKKGISEFINARDINITLKAMQGGLTKGYDKGGLFPVLPGTYDGQELPALDASPVKLIDIGKTWGIQTTDGRVIDTGRKKLDDAQGVMNGYTALHASNSQSTGELVDTGKTWSVKLEDGTLIDTGKTNKNLAGNLVNEMQSTINAVREGSEDTEGDTEDDTEGDTEGDTQDDTGGDTGSDTGGNFASATAMPTGDNVAVISRPAYIDAPTVANPTSIPAGIPASDDDVTPTPAVIYTPQPTADTGTTTPTQPETPTVNPYTGTQAMAAPTYQNILGTQASQFTDRANQQQTFYQPQTLEEKQAAGVNVGKIEQKLYRNSMGLTQYILHVDGVPQTPIPQGYQEVVTQASGGYIRGFQQGGVEVSEEEYEQALKNKQTEAVISPATSVSAAPVANINPDTAGTIMPSTTGQASGVAPIVTDVAQVGTTTQATMPTFGAIPFTQAPPPDFSDVDLSKVPDDVKQYGTPQGVMGGGTAPKGYYVGPADGMHRYGEGPYAEQTQKFLDSIGQTADQFIGKTKEQEEQERLQSLNLLTGSTKPTATGTQEQIKDMTFDPATTEYTSQPVLDENNNPIMDPVLDAQGQPVMEQATNPDGTPKVDADGNPVMQPKTKMRMQTALSDAATITGQQATGTMVSDVDAAQNLEPVLDAQGNPVMEQVFDAQGNPVLDPETGQPVTRAKMKTKATTVEDAPTRTLQTGEINRSALENAIARTFPPNAFGIVPQYDEAKGGYVDPISGEVKSEKEIAEQFGLNIEDYKTGPSELVSGSAVDQAQVGEAFGTGEVEAASVQDEMSSLMAQFEGGDTPAWAAGAMRKATALMSARGLSASSMAGQALIQAAMEAALPIAQIDASNKQQMALFKGEQRAKFMQMEFDQDFQSKVINASKVSEIANMNFNAEQQVALENARMAQTVDLANLNNRQAVVMAEAAALSQLDLANLSNLQQAAVQNAQNFLQVDMANLNNAQQMEMFKQQTLANSILTDAAADNAMAQFNATNELQRDQFMTSMAVQVSQFNAAQTNAMAQFNANEANAMAKYNSEIQNQRELFNAQQYAVIAQANAKWRQDATTMNTAAANQSNFEYAKQVNGLSNKVLDQIWQRERDLMSFGFQGEQAGLDRALSIILGDKTLEAARMEADATSGAAKANLFARMIFGVFGKSLATST